PRPRPLLRYLARRTGLLALRQGNVADAEWQKAVKRAAQTLQAGNLLGLTVEGDWPVGDVDRFLAELRTRRSATILPVYCSAPSPLPPINGQVPRGGWVRVVIGQPLQADASAEQVRYAIHALGDWIYETE